MNELNQNEASPINYLKIFFRRKELLLIPAFMGLILGICTTIILPKRFRSTTVILVEEGKTDNPLFNKLAVSTSVEDRMSNIRETILGWNNLVKLVKRLDLDRDVKTVQEFEQLITEIRKNITIKMRSGNVIELSYIGLDPLQTQTVVKNLTDIFIERNVDIQNQETADAIIFIEDQLKVYEGKIKSAEIAELEDQLTTLLIDSTEKHPTVKQLREQIAKKKTKLEEQNLNYTRSEVIEREESNPIIEEIQKALDSLENQAVTQTPTPGSEVYKVMLIDKLDKMNKSRVMARDVGVNTNIYNMLLQRLETAKITQRLQSSKEGTKYTILDPPRIPHKPFEPNKPLVIFIGLFLGAVTGVAFVVLCEFLDKSFIDVEDAKEFLGVPLLGAISKITTDQTIQRAREKTRWLYSLTVVSGLVLVILTVTISNLIK